MSLPEDQQGLFVATCGAVGWIRVGYPLQVTCDQRCGVFFGNPYSDSSKQSWDLLFEVVSSAGDSTNLSEVHELCARHRNCMIEHRTGIKLFLPSDPHFRGRLPASAIVQTIDRRTSGGRLAERQWGWGMPGWLSIFKAGAAAAGAVVNEEPPRHGEQHGVFFVGF